MALTTKHRTSIYSKLTHILGEKDADAMLAEFPAREADELVTKDFLRAELSGLETRLTRNLMVTVLTALTAQTAILGLVQALTG